MKKIFYISILFLSLIVNAQTDTSSRIKCSNCFLIKNEEINIKQDTCLSTIYISKEVEYCVFNIIGSQILNGCGNKIDMSIFPSGTYFIAINGQTLTIKNKLNK